MGPGCMTECPFNPLEDRQGEGPQSDRALVDAGGRGAVVAASPPWLQEIIVFALHTGMRRGEILNLHWSQVDLTRRTLTILEQKMGREIRCR